MLLFGAFINIMAGSLKAIPFAKELKSLFFI